MAGKRRTTTRLLPSFKRIRKSPHYMDIHSLIVSGVPCSEVARKIQQEYREMLDISIESLEKQLCRYRESLKIDNLAPHERLPIKSWASTSSVIPDDALSKVDGGSSSVGASGDDGDSTMEEKESSADPLRQGYDVHRELIRLYELQRRRIKMEMENEEEINKLISGVGIEISVAMDILKTIHVIEGDLGIRHQEPHKVGVGVMIGLSPSLQEKLNNNGVLAIMNDKKSRKRILNALSVVSSLGGETKFSKMSEDDEDEVIDAKVVEK